MQPDANHPVLCPSVLLSQPYKEDVVQMSKQAFILRFLFFSHSEASLPVPTEPLLQSVESSVA